MGLGGGGGGERTIDRHLVKNFKKISHVVWLAVKPLLRNGLILNGFFLYGLQIIARVVTG